MEEYNGNGTDLYSHHGVLLKIHGSHGKDDDGHSLGTLSIVEFPTGKAIEWKTSEVSVDSETHDQDWSVVHTVGNRTRTVSSSSADSQAQSRCLRIPLSDVKSFRVTRNKQQLTVMQRDGSVHSSFFFQNGNADCFVDALKGNLKTVRSKKDKNLYLILDQPESQVLDRSFAELDLFTENTTYAVWKFVKNLHNHPYETTMEAFSKLTDVLLYKPNEPEEQEVAELLNRSLSLEGTPSPPPGAAEGYEVIGRVLPPRQSVCRGPPLSAEEWSALITADPCHRDVDKIKATIFRGGVLPNIRLDVWKYLLGYYPWTSTEEERQQIKRNKTDEYYQMKLQWRTITPSQELRFSDFRERKSLIEKDVNRTDRTIQFFAGDNNCNLQVLSDVLMTYVMYNFDLGYVQGMSDLLSPILVIMNNEVEAFWCFVGFMDKVFSNFELDQAGMKLQLQQLHTLLAAAEPQLATYLDQNDSANMFFCFRWLLVLFKREFPLHDVMRLWEVLWTDLPCPNFHLLICVAILDTEKNNLIGNRYGFTEILKHVNDLSLHIDLELILCKAESIYLQLSEATELPDAVRRIIGLAPIETNGCSTDGGSDDEANHVADGPVREGPHSIDSVTLVAGLGEAAYEKGLDLHYT
ncbi:TBC1 domain family member 15 isoform X1 [Schistocerca serialis cubense]|uniref:TBC1 domain family member 15 isoform X1 n=2 Tax=Schistocerca serialis cubense TaxID=2023355 RepID=UPI00214E921D|nr:TBC1 domain family member 15 isoform X1 [Schistocerca serialis cubense]